MNFNQYIDNIDLITKVKIIIRNNSDVLGT